jgi:NAD(P)-dependent dehydrogenase (short-subunit alcohol dehydrogenase family)
MMISTASLANALVVTGGSSGIGAALAVEAAGRGYGVVFGGSRPFESLDPSLRGLSARYVQVDVRDRDSVSRFCDDASSYLNSSSKLLVVASAGISTRESDEAKAEMRRINVDGTRNLLAAFMGPLSGREGNRFVGVGSIVAAEGRSVKGDEAYQETKAEIHRIVTDDLPPLGLKGFTLIPGAIDTPMTRKEMVFPMLFLGALADAQAPIYGRLLEMAGFGEATPAALLRALLGDVLTQVSNFDKIDGALTKDPQLARAGKVIFLTRGARDAAVVARTAQILNQLDVVITPGVVARAVLNQFESGLIPKLGMLKVYSQGGADPILGLLSSFG